jgi:hypothetical protein
VGVVKALAGVFLLAAATGISYSAGAPGHLPGAALDWRLLFHVERAAAALAILGGVWLVVWRGLHGEFPIKFGNLEYAAKEAAANSEEATEAQELRLQLVEAILGIADPPPE